MSHDRDETKMKLNAVTRPNVDASFAADLRRELDEVKRQVREVSSRFEKLADEAKDAKAR